MIAKLIADTSSAVFYKEYMIPVPVYWTDDHDDIVRDGIISNVESMRKQSDTVDQRNDQQNYVKTSNFDKHLDISIIKKSNLDC